MKTHSATRTRVRILAFVAVAAVSGLVLSGCASEQEASGGSGTTGKASYYKAAVAEAKSLAKGKKLESSISMIGVNSGAEGQTLEQLYKAFTEGTGTAVNYTGTPDSNDIVQSRLQAGNPPDIADIQMGTAASYAKEGKLMNLSKVMGSELKQNFSQALLDDASVDGNVYGVYQGFSNFMFWYNPEAYTGPKDPTSWSQITDWTDQQAAKGTPVWCAAQNAGASSGFPGAQYIENIFLKEYGPELYRQWGEGTLAWTSPQVKNAFEQFGAIIGQNDKVSGGVAGILSTPIATGYNGLSASPATCQAVMWGSWVPGLIGSTAVPGKTIDFYRIPATNEKYQYDELFQSTTSVAFNDNATTQTFLKFVASTAAQSYLASLNRWPVANIHVPVSAYPSATLQKIAKTYFGNSPTELQVGPNALASAATSNAYYKGVVTYLHDPSTLDSVLQSIQTASQRA